MYKIVGYLGLFMSAFFVASGIYIAASQILSPPSGIYKWEFTFLQDNPAIFNYIVAALLVAYGIFRFSRSVRAIKESRQYESRQ